MTTKHTHPVVFGRKVEGCPRCVELLAGAPVVTWAPSRPQQDARRCREIREHFSSHKHLSAVRLYKTHEAAKRYVRIHNHREGAPRYRIREETLP